VNLQTFFDNFELLAEAPNGIQKLRRLILRLAVQGKLVSQDPNDEPASTLLERVRAEKEKLYIESKSKQLEPLPPIKHSEKAEVIAKGWEWERLGNLARFIDYRGNTPPKTSNGVKLITAKNVRMGFINDEPREYISEETYTKWMIRGFPKRGDLLFTTEAPLGNVAMLATDETIALAQRVIDLQFFLDLYSPYLNVCLMSSLMQERIFDKATGMTAKGIKASKLKLILLPIPPIEEQKRIVVKVDQLMKLCDELEKLQQKKRAARVRLNQSALDHLLAASTPEDFNAHWQRICDSFDLLYDTPETISKLRQSILQLAVQGKLVPQDRNDEPASMLLKKIKAEKERLIREKKIKKGEAQPPIDASDLPGSIPIRWEYTRLGACIELISGQHLVQEEQNTSGDGLPYLTGPADFGKINPTATRWTTTPKVVAEKNDILITVKGAGVGKSNILGLDKAAIGRQIMAIRSIGIENRYLYLLIIAAYNKFQSLSIGLTVPGISRDDILNFLVGIPPVNTQKRIVAKVDETLR
jgi:type I restriction enzyme S subunit